jgi:Leucine-rich repeat (LRR) protein
MSNARPREKPPENDRFVTDSFIKIIHKRKFSKLMQSTFNHWLNQQKDILTYDLRFLQNEAYIEVLNTFYEVKNRMPVALTAVGALIYAEQLGDEYLFSILYPDQNLDFHLADSPAAFEQLLQQANSRDFYLHIAHCPIGTYDVETYSRTSTIPALQEAFGPLSPGEIYGYAPEFFESETRGTSVSHWVSNREIEKTSRQDAATYFSKVVDQFQVRLDKSTQNHFGDVYNDNAYLYTQRFYTSSDPKEDLEKYPANAIKDIYSCYGTEVLKNLRSMSKSELGYLAHTSRLNYFSHTISYSGKEAGEILPLLQNNHQLLRLTIRDEMTYESAAQKGAIPSFELLRAFPLLQVFKISNLSVPFFPEALTKLPELTAICLLQTDTAELPASLSDMKQLRQLHFSDCPLGNQLTPIADLQDLVFLTLQRCGLTEMPHAFSQLSDLEHLDLSHNALGEVPDWIGTLKQLKTLDLSHCGLTTLPASLGDLPQLEKLELKGNAFTDLPASLLKLKQKVALEPKYKALYDEKVRRKLEKDGLKPAVFTDFNFKLLVIQSLMYDQSLLLPKFDVWEFAANYPGRKIDIDEEGMDMIPEVKACFEQLEIPTILLDEIEVLNGGMDVYHELSPLWGGEDDFYDVQSAKDAKLLPNLKQIRFDGPVNKKVVSQLEKLGIEVME